MGTKIVAIIDRRPANYPDEEMRVDKIVADHANQNDPTTKWFYGYVENCFDPTRYLVAGESWEDAYDWLICEASVERDIAIERDEWFVRDYGEGCVVNLPTLGTIARGDTSWKAVVPYVIEHCLSVGRLRQNDNGTVVDDEAVMLAPVAKIKIARETDAF